MNEKLSQYVDIFDKKAFAHVATLMPDGSPHVTPVWVELDKESGFIVFNTSKNRRKERNMTKNPRVSVSIQDPDNFYRYVIIRGKVVEITEENADDHIDKLANKYLGVEKYPYRQPDEIRVIVRIEPISVSGI